jgi:hypothetical protein
MARYEITEIGSDFPSLQGFGVIAGKESIFTTMFLVKHYGLDEARRRAEAECAWLNERAEQWHVVERDRESPNNHSFRVQHKTRPITNAGLALVFYVDVFGLDLARAEADRLCKILNERDASK